MRKIISQAEFERKQRKKRFAIGIILIFVMVSSVLGFAFLNQGHGNNFKKNSSKLEYNNFIFLRDLNGRWQTEIDGQTFSTVYNPKETENINMKILWSIEDFYGEPLYFVADNKEAINELMYNIGRFAQRSQEVCLDKTECEDDFVVKNCSDNIVVYRESKATNIYKQENCIFIEAPYDDQVIASDRLIFEVLGIQ